VVRDEIVILDNRRRIVSVIPADSARGGGAAVSSGAAFVDLSSDEIRQVQLVLIERGFSLEADGRFGPRTRSALIEFQRRQGLEATGRIDSRTVTSLGVSIRSNDQPSTTGQGGDRQVPRGSGGAQSDSPQTKSPMGQGNQQPGASQQGGQTSNQPQTGTSGQGAGTSGQGAGSSAPANPGNQSGSGKPATQPGSSASPSAGGSSGSGSSGGSPGGSSSGGQ
jgi:peptidoglycan hydrolase-like protein with peptidoglycan-binding domain